MLAGDPQCSSVAKLVTHDLLASAYEAMGLGVDQRRARAAAQRPLLVDGDPVGSGLDGEQELAFRHLAAVGELALVERPLYPRAQLDLVEHRDPADILRLRRKRSQFGRLHQNDRRSALGRLGLGARRQGGREHQNQNGHQSTQAATDDSANLIIGEALWKHRWVAFWQQRGEV